MPFVHIRLVAAFFIIVSLTLLGLESFLEKPTDVYAASSLASTSQNDHWISNASSDPLPVFQSNASFKLLSSISFFIAAQIYFRRFLIGENPLLLSLPPPRP